MDILSPLIILSFLSLNTIQNFNNLTYLFLTIHSLFQQGGNNCIKLSLTIHGLYFYKGK